MQALLQKLEPKDILTLTLSSFSFAIAVIALLYTIFSKRRELAISVRNDLHDCILKLSEHTVQFESLRRELGEDFRKFSIRGNVPRLLSSDSFSLREQYI